MILRQIRKSFLLALTMFVLSEVVRANTGDITFYTLTNRDGLSNSQVNAILEDNHGFVWLGTQSGLDRYDGFRFKNFFYSNLDKSSIPNNSVSEIMQDADGNLWIHTSVGYSRYLYDEERFDRTPEVWLKKFGIEGQPEKVYIDSQKNMWFTYTGKGCYFVNMKTHKTFLFSAVDKSATAIPTGVITDISEGNHGEVLLSYRNGTLVKVNGLKHQVLWKNYELKRSKAYNAENTFSYIDHQDNVWIYSSTQPFIYSPAQKHWYHGVGEFLQTKGIDATDMPITQVRDIVKDKHNRLWIATDHHGLFLIDYKNKSLRHFIANDEKGALPDNTQTRLYIDSRDAIWVGTYKNGLAYYSPSASKFSTIHIGDVCTIAEDKSGNLWCGTNDAGIVAYNPHTNQMQHFDGAITGLRSEIVVSSLAASDGSLYFGTFNGGMVRYHDGRWTTYYANGKPNQLISNSIWSLVEDKYHNVIIATLGAGLQIFNPKTSTFTTYNMNNCGIASDYINSSCIMPDGNILLGHSQNFSIMNVNTHKLENYTHARGGKPFPSPSINYAMMDSRGILWLASPAGICMYDPKTTQMELLNELNGTQGAVGCSVIEDKEHTMWIVTEFMVSHAILTKNGKGKWDIMMTNYNSMDGLQSKQFNYRSALLTKAGDIILGGQDGINIIHPQQEKGKEKNIRTLFSGLVLFDQPLSVGEEYEGRVILHEPLDKCRKVRLGYRDNTFTIQLSASEVTVPARSRFLYRMQGVNDKWIMTADNRPFVTFTNLSPGRYTLQVKVVNGDGTINDVVSELEIRVSPPFYLSWFAILIYTIIAVTCVYLYRKRLLEREKERFERERVRVEALKMEELNEMKLMFFTNVSHELRTPLALIISPLAKLIKEETEEKKKHTLELIHRNATRLLGLVNQILDFRKADMNKDKLVLTQTEIVQFVSSVCDSFKVLSDKNITLTFSSTVQQLNMSCDIDKYGKIVNNLLSNAYKFTPNDGSVSVKLQVIPKEESDANAAMDMLRLIVADTGKGISDDEKSHVFERFYQISGTESQPMGSSGIGLNLVKQFADLHGGDVAIQDNPGGGTVFIVDIPMRNTVLSTSIADKNKTTSETIEKSEQNEIQESELLSGEAKVSTSAKSSLLLVDDSDDFREFMNSVLSENYEVTEAVNGQDAWDKLQKGHFDVILSDVMMPEMDGNELCKKVKGNANTQNIPFVMLTARLSQDHMKEGLQNGADDYITKPFDVDMLHLRVQNLLRLASVSKESHEDTTDQSSPMSVGVSQEYVMTQSDRKFLETVNKYIVDNMSDSDASVEGMSDMLCMSRVQLYKRMVSLTGTTPSEYIRAKRIKRAEELIRSGEYNVSEIAYLVGFNNPRYFSKYFQETYGMTPSQYRKSVLGH